MDEWKDGQKDGKWWNHPVHIPRSMPTNKMCMHGYRYKTMSILYQKYKHIVSEFKVIVGVSSAGL